MRNRHFWSAVVVTCRLLWLEWSVSNNPCSFINLDVFCIDTVTSVWQNLHNFISWRQSPLKSRKSIFVMFLCEALSFTGEKFENHKPVVVEQVPPLMPAMTHIVPTNFARVIYVRLAADILFRVRDNVSFSKSTDLVSANSISGLTITSKRTTSRWSHCHDTS